MPYVRFIRFAIVILVFLTIFACAPKNSGVVYFDGFESHHVYGETELETLILVGDYLYENKDFSTLKEAAEGHLQTNAPKDLEQLYVNNLLADLLTYQVVDFQRSFDLNENLIAETKAFPDPDAKLSFDREAHKYIQPSLGSRVLFGAVTAAFAWCVPSAWGDAKRMVIGEERDLRIRDTEFVEKYFTISVRQISNMARNRLEYLESLIGG
jgi:hypothetical protein